MIFVKIFIIATAYQRLVHSMVDPIDIVSITY